MNRNELFNKIWLSNRKKAVSYRKNLELNELTLNRKKTKTRICSFTKKINNSTNKKIWINNALCLIFKRQ